MLQNKLLVLQPNTKGLRENFQELCFIKSSQNIFKLVLAIFSVKKVANVQNFLNEHI